LRLPTTAAYAYHVTLIQTRRWCRARSTGRRPDLDRRRRAWPSCPCRPHEKPRAGSGSYDCYTWSQETRAEISNPAV